MTIASLRPTVSVDNNPNPYVGSTLVGGTTAAADDSDATYGEVWSSRRASVITNDYVRADFDPLALDTLTSVTVDVRYELTSDGGMVTPLDIYSWSGATQLGTFVKVGAPTTGSIVTHTFTYSLVEPLAAFTAALISGDLYLTLGPGEHDGPNPSDKMLRVYEITLTVDYTAASRSRPLRRYPPVNNGGFGPTRHHPRTVNRRVGGSY